MIWRDYIITTWRLQKERTKLEGSQKKFSLEGQMFDLRR